jgi:hypothetical protein
MFKEMGDKLKAALTELEEAQQETQNKREWPQDLEIAGYKLVLTCPACPEQYDVFDKEGRKMGYLRLRHGWFRADAPCCGGDTVYESRPKGDGMFDDDEREPELAKGVAAIQAWWETNESRRVL